MLRPGVLRSVSDAALFRYTSTSVPGRAGPTGDKNTGDAPPAWLNTARRLVGRWAQDRCRLSSG
eukprot:28767-Prorocentrum_minimum.AAC.2